MTNTYSFKCRFSPSPTGLMHLGNLRTALFNALLAKSQASKGKSAFLLRIEDTDKVRSQPQYVTQLLADLRWLGLAWQEGPECEGAHAPYFQSQRVAIYQHYYQFLLDEKKAYWCFCSEAELAVARKMQSQAGQAPRYAGTCRHLSEAQVAQKQAQGLLGALRFKIPAKEQIVFHDFIQGPKTFMADDIGDFIIQKADNSASFMFCNAVDDALMEVTHVLRGEDHLTNTPRQLLVLQALGLKAPQYGHMPLIVGYDGKPLSKRNGSQSIAALREEGYLPLAILNYLSRLGHHFEKEELLNVAELGENFSLERIGRSPARFDLQQLRYWQKEAVLKEKEEGVWAWLKEKVEPQVPAEKRADFIKMMQQNVLLPQEAALWAKRFFEEGIMVEKDFACQYVYLIKACKEAVEKEGTDYPKVINAVSQATALKGKALFLPIRHLLTGTDGGPELIKIFSLMGKEALLNRINATYQLAEETKE